MSAIRALLRCSAVQTTAATRWRGLATTSVLAKGHSHYDNIKNQKGRADQLKSDRIAKHMLSINKCIKAANYNTNVKTNLPLAKLIEIALLNTVPKATIERALERAKNRTSTTQRYYFTGPLGSIIVADAEVDNRPQGLIFVRRVARKIPGFGDGGDVMKQSFEEKGVVQVTKEGMTEESMEEMAIELEAEEVEFLTMDGERVCEITCEAGNLGNITKALEDDGFEIVRSELDLVAFTNVTLPADALEKVKQFCDALLSYEEFERIQDNINWPSEE